MGSKWLSETIDHRDVVIITLHRPDFISLAAESLTCVRADSNVYYYREIIVVEVERTDIIVIMTLVVVSSSGGHEDTFWIGHVMELGDWIPGVVAWRICFVRTEEFLFISEGLKEP